MSASSAIAAFPRHLRVDEAALTFGEVLGQGSFGIVNRGTLNGLPVCIKVNRLSCRRSSGLVVREFRVDCSRCTR
jgi:hypothetical protein